MANRIAAYEKYSETQSGEPSLLANLQSPEVKNQVERVWKTATQWIVANPEFALGVAVVTGVIAGWLIKRR